MSKHDSADPLVRIAEVRFSDVEQYAQVGGGWNLDYVQLEPGKLDARSKIYYGRNASIKHVTYNRKIHQRGEAPGELVSFGILDDPLVHRAYNAPLMRGSVLRFNTPSGMDVVAESGFTGFPVTFTESFLLEVADQIGVPVSPNDLAGEPRLYKCSPQEFALLRHDLHNIFNEAENHSKLLHSSNGIDDVEFVIAAKLLSIITKPRRHNFIKPDTSTRYRGMVRAIQYIKEHDDEMICIKNLCTAANVSWRSLDRAFKEHFDKTPKQYVKCHQLIQVHKALLSDQATSIIADVAARWGFWHSGQFAADYKKLFGELPTETLRSVRSKRSQISNPDF